VIYPLTPYLLRFTGGKMLAIERVGATLARLREAASAKAGRPLDRKSLLNIQGNEEGKWKKFIMPILIHQFSIRSL
jgi:hypothetical protein